jgi:hypothetical protein
MKYEEDVPEDIDFEDAEFEEVHHPVSYSILMVVTIFLGIALFVVVTMFYAYHRNVTQSSEELAKNPLLSKSTDDTPIPTDNTIEEKTFNENTGLDRNVSPVVSKPDIEKEATEIPSVVTTPRIEAVTSSSSNSSSKYWKYTPDQMLDSDNNTAWNTTWSSKRSTWIKVKLKEKAEIATISVVPGYAKTNHPKYGNVFKLNNRLKDVEVRFSSGRQVMYTFIDEPIMQDIKIEPTETCTDFIMEIKSVYTGERWNDVAISELTVSGTESS